MIDRSHPLPIAQQARDLGIIRGSVYCVPRPVSDADLALTRRLDALHLDFPDAGARLLGRYVSLVITCGADALPFGGTVSGVRGRAGGETPSTPVESDARPRVATVPTAGPPWRPR